MLDFIVKLDYWLFSQINSVFTCSVADVIFFHLTDLHKTLLFKVAALPLMIFFFYKKFGRMGVTNFIFLLLALSMSDFSGGVIKSYYGRPRPANNPDITAVVRSDAGHFSFYSNHASNMFTFASYTSTFFPAAKIPLFILAGLVGYSRIYNGVHYPLDVFGGMVMGLFWGYLFSYLVRKLQAWIVAPKVDP